MEDAVEKGGKRAEILRYQYDVHMQMFMHSDNYIQQRMGQFVTMTALLFAGAAVFASSFFANPLPVLTLPLAATALVGLVISFVWTRSYRRSRVYRELHRRALEVIESEFTRLKGRAENLHPVSEAVLMGAFRLRKRIMFDGERQSELVKQPIGFFEKRTNLTGLMILPLTAFAVWTMALAFCVVVWLCDRAWLLA